MFNPIRGRSALLVVSAAVLTLAACKESTGNAPPKVTTVKVVPDSFDLIVNRAFTVQVLVLDEAGKSISGKNPQFRSDDIAVATVSPAGAIIGVKVGKTLIHATVDGKEGTTAVYVKKEPVARVVLTAPDGQVVVEKQTLQLNADPQDAQGNSMADRGCLWSSTNPAVASVKNNFSTHSATVTGVAPGTATISAACETAFQGIVITVTPAIRTNTVKITPSGPQVLRVANTLQLTATAYDPQNNVVPDRPQTWTSANPLAATVDPATGLVRAVAPGNTTITVSIDNVTQQVPIAVTLIPLKSVTVSPNTFDIFETTSRQLTLTAVDSAGTAVTDFSQRSLNVLRSSDLTVASINQSLVVSGVAPGSATIFITVSTPGANDQVSTQATANVKRINTAAVVINAVNVNLTVTQSAQISAVVQDSLGRALQNRPITFTSSDASIFSVQTQGATSAILTGLKAGTATLTATNEGKSSTATVTVK